MLYTKGTAWINGATVPSSSTVFPGDMVQTKPDAIANINALGSSVMILPDSMVKFDGSGVSIDHGTVSVATSKGMSTSAEDLTVAPASKAWTEFQVSDQDGKVQIMARKGNVSISDASGTTTLSEGQETTRDLSEKRRERGGAVPAAGGGILDSPIVIGAGAAAIGGLAVWVFMQSSKPASPSTP
ncbi:MAG TPA: hypothetical protein VLV49_13435 [Terriglobales bacterium]|nr:hypothetical protein [Terriglobales bacterium]